MREIRQLPEAEVIRRWAELYATGKHTGYAKPSVGQYAGLDETWVEVEVPHDRYNADWNTESPNLSSAQVARAERYARQPGALPPGMATFRGRRGKSFRDQKLYVSDGNHRAYASFLRGSPTARFYVPLSHWRRFQQAVEVPT